MQKYRTEPNGLPPSLNHQFYVAWKYFLPTNLPHSNKGKCGTKLRSLLLLSISFFINYQFSIKHCNIKKKRLHWLLCFPSPLYACRKSHLQQKHSQSTIYWGPMVKISWPQISSIHSWLQPGCPYIQNLPYRL